MIECVFIIIDIQWYTSVIIATNTLDDDRETCSAVARWLLNVAGIL